MERINLTFCIQSTYPQSRMERYLDLRHQIGKPENVFKSRKTKGPKHDSKSGPGLLTTMN